ncbi:MAG: FAD-dependent oxidoreductase [Sutterella wadsworthensis]
MHAAVVGAGLTGLQTTLSLVQKGADVTVIEASARPARARATVQAPFSATPHRADRTSGGRRSARLKALASNTSELVYGSGAAVRHPSFYLPP